MLSFFFFGKVNAFYCWSRYTAVGVFVLGKMFLEAWGTEATKKQAEFNQFLEVLIGVLIN